jgi:putative FmdB family regulatory protein
MNSMPLYEYWCQQCQVRFEQITSLLDSEPGKCPQCETLDTQKLLSVFAVGGRGDLRESTLHGCHGPSEMHDTHHHSHDDSMSCDESQD